MDKTFIALGISLGLGLLIGLQRERMGSRIGGIRTFPLISLFGSLCGLLAREYGGALIVVGMAVVFGSLAISNLLEGAKAEPPEPGQTTEFAALLTFAIGAFLIMGPHPVALVAGGVVVVLLQLKEPMHQFVEKMGHRDMTAMVQFVVITLIILPLLPNRAYGPYRVLNPYDIWRMVVLIVGIGLSGYIIYKIWGEKVGTILGGVLGGLISSTATTVTYARRTRSGSGPQSLPVFVILAASTIAYGRVLFELAVVAPRHLPQLTLPIAAMLLWIGLLSVVPLWLARGQKEESFQPKNPAELKTALVFGALYAIVLLAIAAAKQQFGQTALYGVAILSGLTDMDAITLSLGRMVEELRIEPDTGWRLILTASLANLVFKAGAVAFLASWRFTLKMLSFFGLAMAGGLLILWLWPEHWAIQIPQNKPVPGRVLEDSK